MSTKLEDQLAEARARNAKRKNAAAAAKRAEHMPEKVQRYGVSIKDKARNRPPEDRRQYHDVDWPAIVPAWKAGILSLEAILDNYAATHDGHRPYATQVRQHMEAHAIPRDLNGQIVAIAQAKERQALGEVLEPEELALLQARELDDEIIASSASAVAGALIGHRKQVKRFQELAMRLLSEVEHQTINAEDMQQLGELMYAPDDKGVDKLYDMYQKVIATPSRVDSVKKLVETGKMLIGLERQALGVADNANGDANTTPKDVQGTELAQRVAFLLLAADAEQARKAQLELRKGPPPPAVQEIVDVVEAPSENPENWV